MKRQLPGILIFLLVTGAVMYFFFHGTKPPQEPAVPPTTAQSPKTPLNPPSPKPAPVVSAPLQTNSIVTAPPPVNQTRPQSLAARAGQVVPDPNATPLPPETALQNVERAVRKYGDMFGGNPVGTNPEITSQLTGNNPKHINFITSQAGMAIDSDGELVDQWGTPYFFHQLSGSEMEIHSAGPDKIMWTSDDLVTK